MKYVGGTLPAPNAFIGGFCKKSDLDEVDAAKLWRNGYRKEDDSFIEEIGGDMVRNDSDSDSLF